MIRRVVLVLLGLCSLDGCHRSASEESTRPAAAAVASPAFEDGTREVGLDFRIARPSVAGDYFMPDSMGPGAALIDFDGDGDLDLYLVVGFRDALGHTTSEAGANRLYRQDPGPTFVDVTERTGAGHRGYGMGAAVGDIDNDGDLDLYVTNYGPDALFRNEGDGTFADVTDACGVTGDHWSTSAVFFDVDRDGFLDLYVLHYLEYDPSFRGSDAAGRGEYPAPAAFPGVADTLYLNRGDGTFTDVSRARGLTRPGKGLGVIASDLNGDSRVDLYVANDGEPNFAWIQRADGTFADEALRMGIAVNEFGRAEAGMGIACGDSDRDGDDDLFVTHLVSESNTLYVHQSAGSFEDQTLSRGLSTASMDSTGFGTAFVDIDLDADLDLLVANGRVLRGPLRPGAAVDRHWARYAEVNSVFENDGSGRFTLMNAARAGAFAIDVEVSRGLAVGDLDGDGDPDVVVTNANGNVRLYRNRAGDDGHWAIVEPFDLTIGRLAIGAVVDLSCDGVRQRRSVTAAGSYLSSRDPRCYFGLDAPLVDEIRVRWPGTSTWEVFPGGEADGIFRLVKGAGR